MVRLTRAGEYAVRGMVYLSRQSGDGLTLTSDIARAQGVSPSYLAKIFHDLAKAGLVESQRGAAGGISLARPAEEVTLRQIIEAVEGPFVLNRCLQPLDPCKNAQTCPLAPVWREAQDRLLDFFQGVTLDKLNGQPETWSRVH